MPIKQYLTKAPILASLKIGETHCLYIVVSDVSISASLFKEDECRKRRPIFFIGKSLSEEETGYTRSRAGGTGPQGSC